MRTLAAVLLLLGGVLAITSVGYVRAQSNQTIGDREMKLVDFDDLSYPARALAARAQGVVVVRAELDDRGNVTEADAISGQDLLIPPSLANAKKWRFEPNAHKAAVIVYNFRIVDGISKGGCSHFILQAPNFATITSCVPNVE